MSDVLRMNPAFYAAFMDALCDSGKMTREQRDHWLLRRALLKRGWWCA